MQHKATKNTRAENAREKRHVGWVKTLQCSDCGVDAPSEADHVVGHSGRENKILIGHWFVVPRCSECHAAITRNKSADALSWCQNIYGYAYQDEVPLDVYFAIDKLTDNNI